MTKAMNRNMAAGGCGDRGYDERARADQRSLNRRNAGPMREDVRGAENALQSGRITAYSNE